MDWFTRLFTFIFNVASPALVEAAREWAIQFYREAKKTPNPWDDILANTLLTILGVTEIPNVEEPTPETPTA